MKSGVTTKVENIIAVVYRDFGVTKDIPHADAIEWIGSGLLDLGISMVLEDRVDTVEVIAGRAKTPCPIVELRAVREHSGKIPMTYAGGTFHRVSNDMPTPDEYKYRYTANTDYIFPAFETGFIDVSYRSFPLDERGYPLIPADEKVIKALAAFIAYKLDYMQWRREKLSDKVYRDTEQKWLFAKASASTGMKIYNTDQMEALRAAWVRLIPQIASHSTHFTYSGVQEQRNNFSYD